MTVLFPIENCQSTQDEILIFLNKDEACAVFTLHQTEGRGQYGNVWQSLAGQSLAYSFGIGAERMTLPAKLLNYYTAIVVRDFLANMTAAETKIKWPNDIILNGKKVCGILLEKRKAGRNDFYITGIGINILQADFGMLPKAGSILSTTGTRLNIQKFVREFHEYFSSKITQNIAEEKVVSDYNSVLFKRGEVAVFQKDRMRQNGIIRNADADGFLWIELEDGGLRKFFHKEIEMLY